MVNPNKRNVKNKSNINEITTNEKDLPVKEEKKISFIFLLLGFFLLLIGYTLWSSYQTYSNQLVYDME
jgi:hypothetical protein